MKRILYSTVFIVMVNILLITSCTKKDTLTVGSTPPVTTPPPTILPPSNIQVLPFGNLSIPRYKLLATAAGSKVLFIGGRYLVTHALYDSSENLWSDVEYESTRVDLYDTTTHTWSTVELPGSHYSQGCPAAVAGNKIFLADGYGNSGRIDVYDAAANTWSAMQMPEPRHDGLAVVASGNKVFFAGGYKTTTGLSARVDIYDNATNTWAIGNLSEARNILSGASIGNKVFFAGGNSGTTPSAVVDIYDTATHTWSVSSLSQAREWPCTAASGNKIIIAGGRTAISSNIGRIDIYDVTTQTWSQDNKEFYNDFLYNVVVGNNVLFFIGEPGSYFDAFNSSFNTWTSFKTTGAYGGSAEVAVGNQIFIAGGQTNSGASDKVWRIQF